MNIRFNSIKNSGQAMLEFILVLPVFIFSIVGIIDFANAMHCQATLNAQCVEAAQKLAIRLNPKFCADQRQIDPNEAKRYACSVFWKMKSDAMSKENYNLTNKSNCPFIAGLEREKNEITVSATYRITLMTPFISSLIGEKNKNGSITLKACAKAIKS